MDSSLIEIPTAVIAEASASVLSPLILDRQAYWQSQISAILLCLDQHNVLQHYPPRDLNTDWSLNDYRGYYQTEDFAQIRNSIQNWGAQYLMADLFNKNIFRIKDAFMVEFQVLSDRNFTHGICYVSGRDSDLGTSFLRSCRARIFGDQRRRVSTTFADGRSGKIDIRFRDLCVVAQTDPESDGIAFFGEVEGNHGERLLREAFWDTKQDSSFGIGLAVSKETRIVRIPSKGKYIPVLIFGTTQNAIRDFHICIDQFERLLKEGPRTRFWQDLSPDSAREILGYLTQKWRTPVRWLLSEWMGPNSTLSENSLEVPLIVEQNSTQKGKLIIPNLIL